MPQALHELLAGRAGLSKLQDYDGLARVHDTWRSVPVGEDLALISPDDLNSWPSATLRGGRVVPDQDHLIAAILAAGLMAQLTMGHPERDRRASARSAVALYRECLNEMGRDEQSKGG